MVRFLREIIDKFVDGVFEYDADKLQFSVPSIKLSVTAKESYTGSFFVRSENETEIKAYVYSSSIRMTLSKSEFVDKEAEIEYTFNPVGLEPGNVVKGEIQIVSSAGEYYLPYEIEITSTSSESKVSGVRNLFHFTNLAQTEFEEAVNIFYSEDFIRVFDGNDRMHLTKYRGLSNIDGDRKSVENFLVSIHKKKPIELSVEQSSYEFTDVTDKLRCEIVLRKSTWGYTEVDLSSDAFFLTLQKEQLTSADFTDNEHKLVFYINDDQLHEGRNFGTIKIKNDYSETSVNIVARKRESDKISKVNRREEKALKFRLMNNYLKFRTKQISLNSWVRDSMKIVERMNLLDDRNPVSRLFQAQLLMVENRMSEAKWILDHVYNEMKIIEHDDESYAYYLYLTTLYKRDESYINDVAARISSYYANNPTSMPLLWMLFYLDEELSNSNSKKLQAIEKIIRLGSYSPVLYVEAYNVYAANPAALTKLSDLEIETINFAVKNGKISSDIISQLVMLSHRQREFSDKLMNLLMSVYELYNDPELIDVICTLLIRANKTDEKYHIWYRRGVELELKITKLYEYFMYSLEIGSYKELIPKAVIMYFGYSNRLPYEKKAYLYANLIKYRNSAIDLYESNMENMMVFAIEQIMEERINEDLALIYETVLIPGLIKPNMANHLAILAFAKEVKCDNPEYKNVVVVEEEFVGEFVFPIENGKAYPFIYSDNVTIFYEDAYGRRTIVGNENIKKLINENNYVPIIRRYVTNNLPFFLYLCEGKRHYITVEEDNADFCRELVESEHIADSLKSDLRIGLLHHYFDTERITTLDEFLLNIDTDELTQRERAEIVDFLVKRMLYINAYDMIIKYGDESIPPKSVVKICSYLIERNDYQRDEQLTKVAFNAFKNGKYDLHTLKYLISNFEGLTKELRNLWKACKAFDIEGFALTERLIIQMLFTRTMVGEKEEIFGDYLKLGSSTRIEMAYLSFAAYDYFVKERMTDKSIFEQLYNNYKLDEPLNDACKLALLKFYSENTSLRTERIKDMLISFIQEFLHKNVYFKFFSEYSDIVPELTAMTSTLFVEYRTNPKSRVLLHYILEDGEEDDTYRTEDMRNMYEGVFSKEFMLFFGERLQYYVTEERNGREMLTLSDSVSVEETTNDGTDSRYNILNSMVVAKTLQDDATLMDLMEEYVEEDAFAKSAFTIL